MLLFLLEFELPALLRSETCMLLVLLFQEPPRQPVPYVTQKTLLLF